MPIEFLCPQCATQIRTPEATAGKRGKCPKCTAIVQIPASPATSAPAPQPKSAAAAEPAETGPIEFFCSLCGQLVRTPCSAAGKKGKCPHCQGVLQIPLKSRSPKTTPPATSTRTTPPPKPASKPQPKPSSLPPVDDLGLAPLDDLPPLTESKPVAKSKPKSQPVPALDDEDDNGELRLASNPLPPLAPLGSLDSGSSNMGLAPLGGDLFGGADPLQQANAGLSNDLFAGAPLGNDPFAPAAGGSFGSTSLAPAAYSAPSAPAAHRPGEPEKIFLILPAVFQILAVLPFFLWNGFVFASAVFVMIVALMAPEGTAEAAARGSLLLVVILICQVIALGAQIWIIVGSVQMMLTRSYDSCIAAAWLSCVPCFGLFGIPFGIWSLIVLQTPKYQRLFP